MTAWLGHKVIHSSAVWQFLPILITRELRDEKQVLSIDHFVLFVLSFETGVGHPCNLELRGFFNTVRDEGG